MAAHPTEEGAGASRSHPSPRSQAADWGGLAIALGLFLFAGLIAYDASTYPARQSYAQIGPDIFPYIVATGLFIFGALTVVLARRRDFPEREAMNWGPVLWIIAALLAQTIALYGGAGFIVASGILFGGAARGFGRKPLWLTILVGIVLSALLYVLFREGLGLSLPAGLIEPLINPLFR